MHLPDAFSPSQRLDPPLAHKSPHPLRVIETGRASARGDRLSKSAAGSSHALDSARFIGRLDQGGLTALGYRAPNVNAFVERLDQTLLVEALDHFIIFGQKHLDYIVHGFTKFYLEHRPHQSLDNERLTKLKVGNRKKMTAAAVTISLANVRHEKQFGGLLTHYYRKAA